MRLRIFFVIVLIFFSAFDLYPKKLTINGIEVEEKDINKYDEYLTYRAIADMVFENSKVASLKYYERVLNAFPSDFVSLSRMSLIYALRGIHSLSLNYGTNALTVHKNMDKKKVYTLNYIELMVALSISYALVNDEANSFLYLDEARRSLSKISLFKTDFKKASELVNLANSTYRKTFYNILSVTDTNIINRP
ncbi:MAG: hypothetical protein N2712_01830 [Brevinematales bacterium]|nr:hypothetical protein [Brevinematales bacterium]